MDLSGQLILETALHGIVRGIYLGHCLIGIVQTIDF